MWVGLQVACIEGAPAYKHPQRIRGVLLLSLLLLLGIQQCRPSKTRLAINIFLAVLQPNPWMGWALFAHKQMHQGAAVDRPLRGTLRIQVCWRRLGKEGTSDNPPSLTKSRIPDNGEKAILSFLSSVLKGHSRQPLPRLPKSGNF